MSKCTAAEIANDRMYAMKIIICFQWFIIKWFIVCCNNRKAGPFVFLVVHKSKHTKSRKRFYEDFKYLDWVYRLGSFVFLVVHKSKHTKSSKRSYEDYVQKPFFLKWTVITNIYFAYNAVRRRFPFLFLLFFFFFLVLFQNILFSIFIFSFACFCNISIWLQFFFVSVFVCFLFFFNYLLKFNITSLVFV